MDQTEKMKFLSKFTKQEIIEAVFLVVPTVQIEKILGKVYHLKSERLLDERDKLLEEEFETAKTAGKFSEWLKKVNKKDKEIDALYNAYNSLLEKKDKEAK